MARTLSSREFHQGSARVLREAEAGPVFITRRGERRFVVTTVEDYEARQKPFRSFAEALRCPDPRLGDIEDPLPRSREIDPRDLQRMRDLDRDLED
jgi:prevent-host-death family protein